MRWFWCVPTVKKRLLRNLKAQDAGILGLLINIRVLSFAFITSPIVSLIPFALTNSKRLGLLSFAVGTASIVLWLFVFKNLRSTARPLELIKAGAAATILLSLMLVGALLCGSLLNLTSNSLVSLYLFLQLFTGIPFALISGVDSKLSRLVLKKIGSSTEPGFSPNAELRRCKSAGATAATALGALVWCIVLLFHHSAGKQPGWYSVLFGLNIIPAGLLWSCIRRLDTRLRTHADSGFATAPGAASEEKQNSKVEIRESIIAIGLLDGLLQFSQFYFSISAIKALFELVPTYGLLLIAIPLMFYVVNGIEQIGAFAFTRYNARLSAASSTLTQSVRKKQYVSLLILFVVGVFFVLHVVVWRGIGWNGLFDVAAFGVFNIIKGFAGGLSEEWNESMANHYPKHDEARFSTSSALLGRVYQILSIGCFFYLNQFVNSGNWVQSLTIRQSDNPETAAFVSTLIVFISFLLTANFLAYFWIGYGDRSYKSIWAILVSAIVEKKERTALFNQLLLVLFVASLLLANLVSLKVVNYKGLIFAHGSIFYVMIFVIINLITVFEDVEAAIKTVLLGMTSYAVFYTALSLSALLPGYLVHEPELTTRVYNDLIGKISNLYLASFCGYVVTVVLNLGLLTVLSKYFDKGSPVVLGAVVTFVCQLIDTLIFVFLGYGGTQDVDLTSMFIGQFSVKFSVYLVMYFPLYYMILICKRWMAFGVHGDSLSLTRRLSQKVTSA
jgi:uncharacterized PurR-regulated membrane protein YhhQ (DUF165 family)